MMPRPLPETLSVDDAVAYMINLDYRPGSTSLLDMLGYFQEEVESKHDHATTQAERKKYKLLLGMHLNRQGFARYLYELLNDEIYAVKEGKPSKLVLAENEFGSEQIVTVHFCDWMVELGFTPFGWIPPRFWRKSPERKYTTELLHILDDVIETFCEPGGDEYAEGTVPLKSAVDGHIKNKYGPVSDKVTDAIGTIIRPGLPLTTKKDNKK